MGKFYESLPDYKAYQEKMKRLQSGKKDDHTIDKTSLFAQEVFDAMEAEIRILETRVAFWQYAFKVTSDAMTDPGLNTIEKLKKLANILEQNLDNPNIQGER